MLKGVGVSAITCVHTVHTRNVKGRLVNGHTNTVVSGLLATALLTVCVCVCARARARVYASLASICTTHACTDINGILGPVLAPVTSKTHVFAFMSTHTHAIAFMTTHQLSVLADSYAHGLHSAMALYIRQSFSKSATSCDPQFSSRQPVLRDGSRGERGRGEEGRGERESARERGRARERCGRGRPSTRVGPPFCSRPWH